MGGERKNNILSAIFDMSKSGFKKLTPENWREFEETWLVKIKADGTSSPLTADDITAEILEGELHSSVPDDVRNLFEVARGVMCYGGFFYPAYTVGHDQLFKVMEAAVAHKCALVGAPKSVKRYWERLSWLIENEHIPEALAARWQGSRQMRNMTSHVRRQWIITPAMACDGVSFALLLINALFDPASIEEAMNAIYGANLAR